MTNINLASFGAVADGFFDNTIPFSAALAAIKKAGGGTLCVGKGIWRTGPLELFSNTTLVLEEGAVISFIPEIDRYPPVWTRWEGVECYAMHPCIFAPESENINITGKGTLDGSGKIWWDIAGEKKKRPQKEPETVPEKELACLNPDYKNQPCGGGGRYCQFLRPPLLQFFHCKNIRLEGITLKNSPFWTLHPVYCSQLVISGLTITNPHDAPNTDGIDLDSCEDVLVEDCNISVGDDGIAIKSGSGKDGIKIGRPSRRIIIRNCTVYNGHGGVVIGSETAAGISDVFVNDCLFLKTDRGIRIKTRRGRGGHIDNLEFKDLTMEDNLCPLSINMFYRCGANGKDQYFSQKTLPVEEDTPSIKNIRISGLRATGCRASAGFIVGLPESPIENISVNRCEFTTDEQSGVSPDESDMFLGIPKITEKSIRLLNVKNQIFDNVCVHGPRQAFVYG